MGIGSLGVVVLVARGLVLGDYWTWGRGGRSVWHGRGGTSRRTWRLGRWPAGHESCNIDWRRVNDGGGKAARNGRRRTRVFEARLVVPWEPWALRGTERGLVGAIVCVVRYVGLVRVSLRLRGAHLVPDGVLFVLLGIVLVEVDHVHDGLGVLLLLLLRNAILLEHTLPLLGETLIC